MIEDILTKLELPEKEILIYKALLEIGPSNAARIGKEINLPRQTTYSIISNMIEKKVVLQTDRAGVKQFFVEPNELLALIHDKKRILEKAAKDLEDELPKILSLQQHKKSAPKIQYYEGNYGLRRLFENILDQYKKGAEKVFRGYGINHIKETKLSDFLQSFIKERYDKGVETRLMIGKSDDDFEITDISNKYGREIKRINMEPQKAGIYLIGNRIYIFSFEDDVGIMIENNAMTELLKAVFDERWQKEPS
jgi:sugar-specific transcriptional regulator TrmB